VVHRGHAINIALSVDISAQVNEQLPDFFYVLGASCCSRPDVHDSAASVVTHVDVSSLSDEIVNHFYGPCFEHSLEQQVRLMLSAVVENIASRTQFHNCLKVTCLHSIQK